MTELDGPRWGPKQGPVRQLVVLCHGLGADGHDLIDLGPQWSVAVPAAVFAAPSGPEPCDGAPFGRQWFGVGDRAPAHMRAGVAAAAVMLDRFIDAELARLGLGAEAYALMGFSQGAMTALYTGLRRKEPPRGILAFSGALLDPAGAPARADLPPVLIVHGEQDDVVPVSRSRDAEAALAALGVAVESVYPLRLEHAIDAAGLSAGSLFLQRIFAS